MIFGTSGQTAIAAVTETPAVAGLDDRLHPVVGDEHRPDPEEMRHAAGDDEGAEEVEHPAVDQIASLQRHADEGEGDGEVGESDHQIRAEMRPEHVRPPEKAHAVRLKPLGGQEIPDRRNHDGRVSNPVDVDV